MAISTAVDRLRDWRAEGRTRARAIGGDTRSKLSGQRAVGPGLIAQRPDLTLAEVRQALSAQGLAVGHGTVWRLLGMDGIGLEETVHAGERDRPDLDSIEQAFAKFETFLRKAWARTRDALHEAEDGLDKPASKKAFPARLSSTFRT